MTERAGTTAAEGGDGGGGEGGGGEEVDGVTGTDGPDVSSSTTSMVSASPISSMSDDSTLTWSAGAEESSCPGQALGGLDPNEKVSSDAPGIAEN